LPWIADFRDPMAQDGYPADPMVWRSFKQIEEHAVSEARFSVFTTLGAARVYRERYPDAGARITAVENGYDEESFTGLFDTAIARQPLNSGALTLLHSGVVYPSERDPTQFFAAIRRLADAGTIRPDRLKVRFRAPAHAEVLRRLAREYGIEPFIELFEPVSYRAALEEMIRADALLVLQASNCNEQIPAKLYEYLRAARPILGLTDPQGDTAAVLREAGLDTIAPLDSVDDIAATLERFISAVTNKRAPLPNQDYVTRSSRRARTQSLVRLLEQASTHG
jgi:glycosyltransferase involved in cell wall biosynthesis